MQYGYYHRVDGPAIIYPNGACSWYIVSKRIITNAEFQSLAKLTDEEMTMLVLKYGNVK
jgi:hypothetical protein